MKTELENKLVKKYPEFFEYLKTHKGPLMPMVFGFEHGDGWFNLLDKLMGDIISYHNQLPEDKKWKLSLLQVKEKYGGLRFYLAGADDYIWDLINNAEEESYNVCEICGSKENIGHTQVWIKTVCKPCFDDGKTNMNIWKSKEEKNDGEDY